MIPTRGQAGVVVSLNGDRLCNGDLHCHMCARHPSDAGMSPPTREARTALKGSNRPSAMRQVCQVCAGSCLLAVDFNLARTGS